MFLILAFLGIVFSDFNYNPSFTNDDFITITNNFTQSDYHLYSLERSGTYEEILNQRAIRANFQFNIKLYMTSDYCPNYTYICELNSSSDNFYEKIIQDSDAPSTCQSPYLYYITIKNNFSEIEECQLYYLSNFGRYVQITNQYSKGDTSLFSIDLYMKSEKCTNYTYICSVNSSLDKTYEKVINDLDAPNECITGYSYFATIINNFSEIDYCLYYSSLDGSYTELETSYFEKSTSPFAINIYMISDYCTEITYICTVNSSLDQYYELVIEDKDAPAICQSPYIYFITIINNFTKSDFHLYYLTNLGKYEEIGSRFFEQRNSSFSINLYMTSYECQQYTLLDTVESSNEREFEKVINDSDAPNNCQPTYYVTIENKFSRSDYHLFYLKANEEFEKIADSVTIKNSEQFSIDLYMSSPYCTNYNFIISLNATLEAQFTNKVNDSYAPLICQYESKYYLTIINCFTIAEYHLYYYLDSSGDYEEIENSHFISYPEEFSARIFMKSENCPEYKFLTIAHSSTNKSYEKAVGNSDVPEICQPFKYFLTIINSFTEPDFHLYYSKNKRIYTEIENLTFIQDHQGFTVFFI